MAAAIAMLVRRLTHRITATCAALIGGASASAAASGFTVSTGA